MMGSFERGEMALGHARRAVDLALERRRRGDGLVDEGGRAVVHALGEVQLLAPVPRPRHIRDHLSYTGQAAAGLAVPPAFVGIPVWYECNVDTVVGTGEELLWPSYTDQIDFELELGFVTSGAGRDLSPGQVQDRIAGITIFNDVAARDVQVLRDGPKYGSVQDKDVCTAMGPCVVTMDEVDEWAVEMSATINGEVWATGTTEHRQLSFAEVRAWASLDEQVYPGEFVALGTVGGGYGLELDRWIQPSDVVELEATGVGVLRNVVGDKQCRPDGAGVDSCHGSPRARAHRA